MLEMKLARILSRPGEPGGKGVDCLDDAALAALVDGGLSPAERAGAESHLADCAWCVRRLALLDSLASEESAREPLPESLGRLIARPVGVSRRRYPSARWAAAAALVALLSGGLGWQLAEMRHRPGGDSTVESRDREALSALRESQRVVDENTGIELLAPVGSTVTLDDQRQIQWSEVPGSLFYTVTVAAADGTPLWEEESRRTELRLPIALALDEATTYYVQVRAHLPDGRTLRSGHIELELDGD